MKIATYNILKGGTRRVHWLRLLEEWNVDLLLLQETYPHTDHLPAERYPNAAQQTIWVRAGKNRWGSAIFSRSGIVTRVRVPHFDGWVTGARIRHAAWQSSSMESLLVFSIHAPAGGTTYARQVNRILDAIHAMARGRDLIIGGDFNLTISPWLGSERPTSRADWAIQARLTQEFGLLNCWQTLYPDQQPAQTLRWTGNRTIPYHCDGLFVPRSWEERLVSCVVPTGEDWDALSDHNPVVAQFR
ncbi:MAG: endonuclease/exonuclease/phosphatase family protein [Bacteroidales bacterium]|nr:endonuclease/exonuclease/phosphatase family protein [Bacteroidales bacterium]